MYTAAVITVSDRSFRGERPDEGGPRVRALLEQNGYRVVHTDLVPDEPGAITGAIIRACDLDIALVVTTGGTGLSPRDVTPEATMAACERMAPGIAEAMRMRSLAITERAMLSRGVSGVRSRSLVINLPGSPKAAEENFTAVASALEHGLMMLRGGPQDCATLG